MTIKLFRSYENMGPSLERIYAHKERKYINKTRVQWIKDVSNLKGTYYIELSDVVELHIVEWFDEKIKQYPLPE